MNLKKAISDLKKALSTAHTNAEDIDASGDVLDGDALDDMETDLHIASTRLKELQKEFDRRMKWLEKREKKS